MTLIRSTQQHTPASFAIYPTLFLLLPFLFLLMVDLGSGTLYRIGSDVTITCSKQQKGDFSYDPTLDVKLASAGGDGKREREGTEGRNCDYGGFIEIFMVHFHFSTL